nr:MAG TPA: hypothetical protein [Caudoviricetes sp.]DAJ80018.1 MAG TPA: hypothetical protein [Caudoviricetes sp.]
MLHFRKEELWILFYCANGDNLIVANTMAFG